MGSEMCIRDSDCGGYKKGDRKLEMDGVLGRPRSIAGVGSIDRYLLGRETARVEINIERLLCFVS